MARGNAVATIIAGSDRMWVVTTRAVEITTLQKYDEAIARSIDTRIGQNFTDCSPGGVHGSLRVVYVREY
jgi:hypothetical protein